jgi:hypothetical protein
MIGKDVFEAQGVLKKIESSLPYNNQLTGKLNPVWTEWLMGYPEGWTDLNS